MRDVRGGQGLEKPRGKAIIAPKGSITLLALDFAPENCAKSVTDRLDTYTLLSDPIASLNLHITPP